MKKEVVILTVSSKNRNYCVAGIDTSNGEWIRLVSDDEESHGALSKDDIRYEDRTYCQPLDVVKIPIIEETPLEYQPENVLIDTEKWWKKTGECTIDDLLELHPAESHTYLLGNQYAYITEARIGTVGHSLILVKVKNLTISHPAERKTKATFTYKGDQYNDVAVTDPDFYNMPTTYYKKALLVMSLPDTPFPENKYFKFIAKIFPLD